MGEIPKFLTEMSEQQRHEAFARYETIRPYVEDGVPQVEVARQSHVPVKTLQRWVARYRKHGLRGLARLPRADRGTRRGMPKEQLLLIEGLALSPPRRSMATIHRLVGEVSEQEGWPLPSYRRVCQIVRGIKPSLMTLAQEGDAAYRDRYELILRYQACRPNERWIADHYHLRIWLIDDDGEAVRPWLTVILDDYSRAVAGYRVTVEAPTALHTALTLRQAILRKPRADWPVHGIPTTFYTDHGKDFTSAHLEQVAAELHMRLVFSRQGRPRGRGKVERFFETVEQLLLQRLPGYTPREKGLWPDEREKREEERAREAACSVAAFEQCFETWVVEQYHQRVHSEVEERPVKLWEEGAFVPRVPDRVEHLDLLLLTVPKERKVRGEGISFQGYWYTHPHLTAYVGEQVVIRYDPADLAEIRVYFEHRFLCRALCAELSGEQMSLQALEAERRERRRRERGQLRERKAVVKRLKKPVALPEPILEEEDGEEAGASQVKLKRYEHE
jgi:putative transposase